MPAPPQISGGSALPARSERLAVLRSESHQIAALYKVRSSIVRAGSYEVADEDLARLRSFVKVYEARPTPGCVGARDGQGAAALRIFGSYAVAFSRLTNEEARKPG